MGIVNRIESVLKPFEDLDDRLDMRLPKEIKGWLTEKARQRSLIDGIEWTVSDYVRAILRREKLIDAVPTREPGVDD